MTAATTSAQRPAQVLRMVTADRNAYRDEQAAAAVHTLATYLDDVVAALGRRGIGVGSVEIDARTPLKGRLVLIASEPADSPVLDWRPELGWWMAPGARLGTRPSGWRQLCDDPHASPAFVAVLVERRLGDAGR